MIYTEKVPIFPYIGLQTDTPLSQTFEPVSE